MMQVFPLFDAVKERQHLIHFQNDTLYIDGLPTPESSPLRKAVINLLMVWEDHYEGVDKKWDVS